MKYKLTDETIEFLGKILHRIEALKDFGDVKAGDIGGYIESTRNLSQGGNAWVYDDAWVCGNVLVCGEALVRGNAEDARNGDYADSLLLRMRNEEAVHAVKAGPTVVCKTCAVNDALTKRIEELEGNQWIPCSEKLPEEYEYVLACADDEKVYVAIMDYTGWQDVHSYQYIYEVVAWQPLPESYEE